MFLLILCPPQTTTEKHSLFSAKKRQGGEGEREGGREGEKEGGDRVS